ncbi:MAG: hypothetical protein QXI58_02395 [Candidatus Micrarchaeia archaeon]
MKIRKKQSKINQKFEEYYHKQLFRSFIKDFPKTRFLNKTIEFSLIYQWFSYRRIGKKEARLILKEWVRLGLCERKRYHGILILNTEGV